MKKTPLDPNTLTIKSFDTAPALISLPGAGLGTACFETCKTDPTSDPDAETCGPG
jgi:hypothetical protein